MIPDFKFQIPEKEIYFFFPGILGELDLVSALRRSSGSSFGKLPSALLRAGRTVSLAEPRACRGRI